MRRCTATLNRQNDRHADYRWALGVEMAQIRAATDTKEKERLVNEHMKTMEESMSRMQGMMGCGKM